MQLRELVAYTNRLAIDRFSDYCPNGLQVEGRAEIRTLVGGVTACQALLGSAGTRADAVLVHHGYFWKGEDPCLTGMKYRRLATLLRHEIGLLAYHLPLDAHPELGNNAQSCPGAGSTVTGTIGGDGRTPGLVMLGDRPRRSAARHSLPLGHPARSATPAHCGRRRANPPTGLVHRRRAILHRHRPRGGRGCLPDWRSVGTDRPFRPRNRSALLCRRPPRHRALRVQALGAHLAQAFDLRFAFIDIDNPV